MTGISNGPIDRGVPVPKVAKGRKRLYMFDDLAVGDSRVIKGAPKGCVASCASYFSRKHRITLVTRTEADGVRVTRTR